MANRQYIGARYVPKFFNNNGSNEWVSGIAYEALTIVTYLNNSYTSVKPVPSNVGSPNLATEYWACTGNISGVVSDLSDRITTAEGDIDALELGLNNANNKIADINNHVKKYWLISDSFLRYTNNWGIPFDSYTGQTSHKTYEGGGGFNCPGNQTSRTILQIVQDDDNVPEDITDVVLYAGANDCQADYYDVTTAFKNTLNAIKTKVPNAQIWVSCNGTYCTDETSGNTALTRNQYLGDVYFRMMKACMEIPNVCFVKSAWYSIQDKRYLSDCVHPTQDGYNLIAKAFINKIYNGSDINPITYTLLNGVEFELCDSEYVTVRTNEYSYLYNDSENPFNMTALSYKELTSKYATPNVPRANNNWDFNVFCRFIYTDNSTHGGWLKVNVSRDGILRVASFDNHSNVKTIQVVCGASATVPLIRQMHG